MVSVSSLVLDRNLDHGLAPVGSWEGQAAPAPAPLRLAIQLRERWETSSERAGAKLALKAAERVQGAAREGQLHLGKRSFPLHPAADVLGLRSAWCIPRGCGTWGVCPKWV